MSSSKEMRECSAESDALHLAMGWSFEDLGKKHIIIESTYGESHPGSSHLLALSHDVRDGVLESGGRPAMFCCTDMCDGVAQGGVGGYYSLMSRDFICAMCEIHAMSTMADGIVLLSSCDKSMPAHIMAAARLNIPTVIVPGGSMAAGAGFRACDTMWESRRELWRGKVSEEQYGCIAAGACPGAGACQQFATASTMQAMAEALGMALPGSALIPVTNTALSRSAVLAGRQAVKLAERGLNSREIMTREAFLNAVTVHAAVGGSANAIMHLIAAANEAGVRLDLDDFDRIHRNTPYMVNVQSTGKYPTEYFWYAGGLPALMWEIRDLLDLDVMTVTGEPLGANLEKCHKTGYYLQRQFLENYGLDAEEIISPRSAPRGSDGGIAILKGNIASIGAVIKHSAVLPEMMHHTGPAKVFNTEDQAIEALNSGKIVPGDIIVVFGWGIKTSGMPELFRLSDEIASNDLLARTTAIITDGRYSGCTRGPAIGYLCPDAADGGEIGYIRDGDMIEIDIPGRRLDLVEGEFEGKNYPGAELLELRRANMKIDLPEIPGLPEGGALSVFRQLARSPLLGGNI
ncbi:MAG: dihydroxy-acid dehydratase [Firmicutes bacterium]|nr:dihydroxy-acid dehydratase [Bacillota bacterium]